MKKQKRETRYSVVVFSDAGSAPRKWAFLGRTLRAAAIGGAFLFVLFLYFSYHYSQTYNVWGMIEAANEAKQNLLVENERYAKKIKEMLTHQAVVEERIGKLATMVGVETLGDALSMGGEGGVTTNEFEVSAVGLPENSAKSIVELESKQSLADHNLTELEKIFSEKQHLLSFIPSIWPVEGLITTAFGWRRDPFTGQPELHKAVDISCRTGTPVRAPADGVVVSTNYSAGYGNTVVLSHGFGYVTRFAHLHSTRARAGERVQRGDIVAYAGSTGRSTGPHLHYEILINDNAVNARNFVLEEVRRF